MSNSRFRPCEAITIDQRMLERINDEARPRNQTKQYPDVVVAMPRSIFDAVSSKSTTFIIFFRAQPDQIFLFSGFNPAKRADFDSIRDGRDEVFHTLSHRCRMLKI